MKWKKAGEDAIQVSTQGSFRVTETGGDQVFRPIPERTASIFQPITLPPATPPTSLTTTEGNGAANGSISNYLKGDESSERYRAERSGSFVSESSRNGNSLGSSGNMLVSGIELRTHSPNLENGSAAPTKMSTMGSRTTLIENTSRLNVKLEAGWINGLEATLAALSLAAGIGNVMRLPRIVYLNGEGAFLVIYVIITIIFGIPLVFFEMMLGQFCPVGTTRIWESVPLLKGVGYAQVLASLLLALYYPIFVAFSLFFVVWCGKGPVPFSDCNSPSFLKSSSAERCFQKTVLKPPDEDAMWFCINITFLFLAWAFIFLCLFRSSASYRKASYFLIIPVVACLVVTFISAVTRDPSIKGLNRLMTFDWNHLLHIEVWHTAVVQMLFSTHVGFGNLVTCAGRLYSKTSAFWTAVSYIVFNLLIGIIAVFTVYVWIGMQAPTTYDLPEIFFFSIVYEAASKNMGELHQLWAALTFFVVTVAGLSSAIALAYTVLAGFTIETKEKWVWWHVVAGGCIVFFILGILCMVPHQLEIIHMFEHYAVRRIIMMTTILELIAFYWIYGYQSLYEDLEFVYGQSLTPIWKILLFITPVLLIVIEIWSFIIEPFDGLGNKTDPMWLYVTGWALYCLAWALVVCTAVSKIYNQVELGLKRRFLEALKPSRDWGPGDPIARYDWKRWRNRSINDGLRDFTLRRRGTRDYTQSVRNASALPMPTSAPYTTTKSISGFSDIPEERDCSPFTLQPNGHNSLQHFPKGRYWHEVMQATD